MTYLNSNLKSNTLGKYHILKPNISCLTVFERSNCDKEKTPCELLLSVPINVLKIILSMNLDSIQMIMLKILSY